MFRHSEPLLFRPMPTLKKFKIHPPLPLNPRQSKQLLNLLTTSFRQQLDTAHGFRTDAETSTTSNKQNHNAKERRRSNSDSIIRPTDLHISSLLANPLFSGASDDSQPLWKKDPKAIFHLAVAKGMMDLKLAKLCLIREKNRIIQSSVLSVQQGMKESGAGLKVLRWLVASGMTNDNTFLKDQEFAEILMEFIVAEELQEISWKWIKRAIDDLPRYTTLAGSEKQEARKDLVRPLMSLIKAEAYASNNLDPAYLCLSRAAGYLKGMSSSQMMVVLGPPGNFLSHLTNIAPLPDHQPPSESAFDSFLSLVPTISQNTEYHFAQLNLRHPSHPSADSALSYLRKMNTTSIQQNPEQKVPRVPMTRHLIELGLNTAKFLLEKERFDDAEWVMSYLQRHFPQQLGVQRRNILSRAKAEASSLQLLEGLSFA